MFLFLIYSLLAVMVIDSAFRKSSFRPMLITILFKYDPKITETLVMRLVPKA